MTKDDRLIYLVFKAQQVLRTYLKKALEAQGIKVTPAQAGVLFLLKQKDGQSMSDLSRILAIDNSTLTGLIDRMRRSGFVRRQANPADRRVQKIFITNSGIREIDKAKPVIQRVNQEIKTGFSEADVEALKKVLGGFFEKFGNGQ